MQALAVLAILWGVLISLGAMFNYLDPTEAQHHPASYLILGLVLGVFPMIWGFRRLAKRGVELKFRQQTAQQLRLIEVAKERTGQLTLAEAMVVLNLDLPQTKKILDEMLDQNAFELQITSSGALVYRLHVNISSQDEKGQSVLE